MSLSGKGILGSVSLIKHFSYKDIKRATDGFRRIFDTSSNGGVAYRARFQNGQVAFVKEIKILDDQDDDVFFGEVRLLARLHHRHIVALRGFSSGPKRFLVFESTENGSLKDHLSDPLKTPLNWRTRLQIAIGIAAALEYLHFFCDPPLYLATISSSTIMLDENFTAKLADISLLCSVGSDTMLPESSCSKVCRGERCKNLVFQLGVLILELITGQSAEDGGGDLVKWVQESRFRTSIYKMLDPDLGDEYDSQELKGLLTVARLCIKSANKPAVKTSQILCSNIEGFIKGKRAETGSLLLSTLYSLGSTMHIITILFICLLLVGPLSPHLLLDVNIVQGGLLTFVDFHDGLQCLNLFWAEGVWEVYNEMNIQFSFHEWPLELSSIQVCEYELEATQRLSECQRVIHKQIVALSLELRMFFLLKNKHYISGYHIRLQQHHTEQHPLFDMNFKNLLFWDNLVAFALRASVFVTDGFSCPLAFIARLLHLLDHRGAKLSYSDLHPRSLTPSTLH
nr:probable receptor-like protein kinase At1g49730 [Ipomoea batatas]